MNELHLFAGAGGGILGGMLLGHTTVCAVEIEPYPRQVLLQRQRDGILPKFPIWDDICTFDGKPWRGKVDIVAGGFPCQDISIGNTNPDGINGERSGLWKEMARIISEIQPRYAFVENSPLLIQRGLGVVLADIAEMGFDAKWGVIGADDIAGVHRRERFWMLCSHPDRVDVQGSGKREIFWGKEIQGEQNNGVDKNQQGLRSVFRSGLRRGNNELADQVDRLKAIGNGQVPQVARLAWKILTSNKGETK
jgi:DNA (cytosine-5)-methyltransferase 1